MMRLKMNCIKLKDMKIKLLSTKQVYDFKVFKTMRSFGDSIYNHKIEIHEANQEQADLLEYILSFNNKTKPRSDEYIYKKNDVFDSSRNLYEGRKFALNAFKSGLFPLKSAKGAQLKILTPKQMLQRLPIALPQVKAENNSENLLNLIRQIVYSLYQSKKITKKVYNNIIKLIQI